MVRGTSHSAHAIVARGKATSHGSLQQAVAVAGIVDALEEDELGGVRGLLGRDVVAKVLDRDVGVADDVASAVEVLGRRVVGHVGVRERSRGEVVGLNDDVEVLVLVEVVIRRGVLDDAANHLVR